MINKLQRRQLKLQSFPLHPPEKPNPIIISHSRHEHISRAFFLCLSAHRILGCPGWGNIAAGGLAEGDGVMNSHASHISHLSSVYRRIPAKCYNF